MMQCLVTSVTNRSLAAVHVATHAILRLCEVVAQVKQNKGTYASVVKWSAALILWICTLNNYKNSFESAIALE